MGVESLPGGWLQLLSFPATSLTLATGDSGVGSHQIPCSAKCEHLNLVRREGRRRDGVWEMSGLERRSLGVSS